MKIALVSSEAYPLSKTGGLGDVVGSLFKELIKNKTDVNLSVPLYRKTRELIGDNVTDAGIVFGVPLGAYTKFGAVKTGKVIFDNSEKFIIKPDKNGNVFFIEHNEFFDREEIYGTSAGEYLDNAERFVFFSRGVLEVCKVLNLKFDVIHCHDWHTALIPLYLKTLYRENPCFSSTKSVFTIHNLGYQGVFPREKLDITGFGWEMFHIDGLEFYGMVNFMKGGLFGADIITTVSPTYAKEILLPEYGFGLDGVLRKKQDIVIGILNGIDYQIWNPQQDPFIIYRYGIENFHEKFKNKEELIKITGIDCPLDKPLLAFIGRLVSQKGLDILFESIPALIDKEIRIIFEGTGERYYENRLREIQNIYPSKIFSFIGFDEALAHKIYAGADALLIPSKYEPCGLGQFIAMRYGTIPICRKTGGLADTVEDGITGFLFSNYDSNSLISAVFRFLEIFNKKESFYNMICSAMKKDFSWNVSSKKYLELYKGLINERKTSSI